MELQWIMQIFFFFRDYSFVAIINQSLILTLPNTLYTVSEIWFANFRIVVQINFFQREFYQVFDAFIGVLFGWLSDQASLQELEHFFSGNVSVAV